MRFTKNRIDFYDGWAIVNGIIFDHFSQITCGLSEVCMWDNEKCICSIPVENIQAFYVAENDIKNNVPVNEKEISKWIKKQINSNLNNLTKSLMGVI